MTALQLTPVSEHGLTVDAALNGDLIAVSMTGTADHESPAVLDAYLHALHNEAIRVGATAVEVSVREVEFLNSACIKSLTGWIGMARNLPSEQRYEVRFDFDPAIRWQKLCMQPLRSIGVVLISSDAE